MIWPPAGAWLEATCAAGHASPARDCDCGIHAWHPRPRRAQRLVAARAAIPGVVEASGAIEVHEDGFRAQLARPCALVLAPGRNPSARGAARGRLPRARRRSRQSRRRSLPGAARAVSGSRKPSSPSCSAPRPRSGGGRGRRRGAGRALRTAAGLAAVALLLLLGLARDRSPGRPGPLRSHRRDPRAPLTSGPRELCPRRPVGGRLLDEAGE